MGFIDKAISIVVAAGFLGTVAIAITSGSANLTGIALTIAALITFAYAYAVFQHAMPKGGHGL